MPAELLKVDYDILYFLNVKMAHPMMDPFWVAISRLHKFDVVRFGMIPILLLLGFYIYRLQFFKPLLVTAVGIAAVDGLAYRVIKSLVQRPRPFQNPEIAEWLRKAGEAHGSSFPSNHAANCTVAAILLGWYFPRLRKLFYLFALLVIISRPALGVHYPSDVFAGWLLGFLVAFLIRSIFLNRFRVLWMTPSVPRKDWQSEVN